MNLRMRGDIQDALKILNEVVAKKKDFKEIYKLRSDFRLPT